MTPFSYLPFVPMMLLVLFGMLAPHVAAALTRAPGYVAGALTTLMAALDGFLVQWAHQDHGYSWKLGLYNAFVAWLVALGTQYGVLRQTGFADRLHTTGPQLGDVPPVPPARP